MTIKKVMKLREVTWLHDIWLRKALFGRGSVSPEELTALENYGKLPMDIDLSKSLALVDSSFAEELIKADIGNPMKQPVGPKSAQAGSSSTSPSQPSNMGSGKPPSGVDRKNLTPVSKKDHPKRPAGTVDETENTWYVKPGSPNAAVSEEEVEQNQQAEMFAKQYGKMEQPPLLALENLKNGKILKLEALGEGEKGVTDSYKVLIERGGHALMKPDIQAVETWQDAGFLTDGASIPAGTHTQREEAAYSVTMTHGLTKHVPPTTNRTFGGSKVSMQKWMPGMRPGNQALLFGESTAPTVLQGEITESDIINNPVRACLAFCSADKRDSLEQKFNECVVLDYIINNNDRHFDNVILSEDFSDFRMIDHSFSFGNGLEGSKNEIHHSLHNMNKKVRIPEKLQTKMKNMSFNDYKRATPELQNYEAGQAFLRNRYLLHLQETEGHLDYEKFRSTLNTPNGDSETPHPYFYENLPNDEFEYRQENGLLPNQLFESWAKAYLEKASADSSHPDHVDAKRLSNLGVFMGPGAALSPGDYRKEKRHKEYEKSIVPRFDLPTKIRRDTVSSASPTIAPPSRKKS